MSAKQRKLVSRGLIALLTCFAVTAGTAVAAEFHLIAAATTKTMPDGAVIPMWGFALDPAFGGDGVVTVPGPILEVPPGDNTLTIHVENTLPEAISIIIPGQITSMSPVKFADSKGRQRIRSFTHETANGATGTYVWTNFKPGTYLYQSGTHPAVQVQMGLYGAVTKDAATGEAYAGISYDENVVLVYSEIDPALHQAVDNGSYGTPPMTSTIDYQPKYFLINGRPYSAANPPPTIKYEGERILIRFLNAGLQTHAPLILDKYMTVIAEDGNVLPYPKEQYLLPLPAGQTKDVIGIFSSFGRYVLFDRRLFLTNAAAANGGMLTFLVDKACLYDLDGDGIVGPGDFALFPPCWLSCDTDPEWNDFNCENADFDGNGCIDSGDISFFASGWRKLCKDTTIVLP